MRNNCGNTDIPSGIKGVYVLILSIDEDFEQRIGSLGVIKFRKGIYLYVGSAMGPGGLRSRISRHYRRDKKIHWHIDYLTTNEKVNVIGAIYLYDCRCSDDLENKISRLFSEKLHYIEGFGNSDKRNDRSHLFYCMENNIECINLVKNILECIAGNSGCKIGETKTQGFSDLK